MKLYLTSSPTGPYRSEYGDHPALDASNGFVNELHAEGYLLQDGVMTRICDRGESRILNA